MPSTIYSYLEAYSNPSLSHYTWNKCIFRKWQVHLTITKFHSFLHHWKKFISTKLKYIWFCIDKQSTNSRRWSHPAMESSTTLLLPYHNPRPLLVLWSAVFLQYCSLYRKRSFEIIIFIYQSLYNNCILHQTICCVSPVWYYA